MLLVLGALMFSSADATAGTGKVVAVRTHREQQMAVKIVEKSSLSPVSRSALFSCLPPDSAGVLKC